MFELRTVYQPQPHQETTADNLTSDRPLREGRHSVRDGSPLGLPLDESAPDSAPEGSGIRYRTPLGGVRQARVGPRPADRPKARGARSRAALSRRFERTSGCRHAPMHPRRGAATRNAESQFAIPQDFCLKA